MCWKKPKLLAVVALFVAFATTADAAKKKKPAPERTVSVTDAKKVLEEMVATLEGHRPFRVDGCPRITPGQWAALLLTGEAVVIDYRFGADCDIEGRLRVVRETFPLDLKVRNIPDGDRIRGSVTSEITPDWKEKEIRVNVVLRDGFFEKKGTKQPIEFTAAYRVATGLEGKDEAEKKPTTRTGELHMVRFRGRTVDLRSPLR